MRHEQEALFAGILENPDDDAPRLIYADWLEEHEDEERANFIRWQIALHQMPWYAPEYYHLRSITEALLLKHRTSWQIPLQGVEQVFNRGFVAGLRGPLSTLYSHWSLLSTTAPICGLHLTDAVWTNFEFPLVNPLFLRLKHLTIEASLAVVLPAVAPSLLQPHLHSLNCPDIATLAYWLSVCQCPALTDLTIFSLRMGEERARERLFALLVQQPPTTLRLWWRIPRFYSDAFRATEMAMLAVTDCLEKLRVLDLTDQKIGDAGLRHLANSPVLHQLEELHLARNDIGLTGEVALEEFCASANFSKLKALNLSGNHLAVGCRTLADWPGLVNLRWLNVSDCGFSKRNADYLRNSPYRHPDLVLLLDEEV